MNIQNPRIPYPNNRLPGFDYNLETNIDASKMKKKTFFLTWPYLGAVHKCNGRTGQATCTSAPKLSAV